MQNERCYSLIYEIPPGEKDVIFVYFLHNVPFFYNIAYYRNAAGKVCVDFYGKRLPAKKFFYYRLCFCYKCGFLVIFYPYLVQFFADIGSVPGNHIKIWFKISVKNADLLPISGFSVKVYDRFAIYHLVSCIHRKELKFFWHTGGKVFCNI